MPTGPGALAVDGATLWFEVVAGAVADAPAVLLLHGGLGLDHTTLRPWLDALAGAASALVYVDHRGNGRSSEPADWTAVDHGTLAADIEAVRAHVATLGVPADRIVLFGHSYGGFLALEYALRHPRRIAALVLCATAPTLQHGDGVVDNARRRGTPEELATVLELLGGPVGSDADFGAGMRTIAPLYFHAPDPARCSAVFGDVRFRAAAFNRAFFALVPAFDVRDRLDVLEREGVPILLLGGASDWIMPTPVALDALAAALPSAHRVEFAESGHFPFVEEPEAFSAAVLSWLDASRRTPDRGSAE